MYVGHDTHRIGGAARRDGRTHSTAGLRVFGDGVTCRFHCSHLNPDGTSIRWFVDAICREFTPPAECAGPYEPPRLISHALLPPGQDDSSLPTSATSTDVPTTIAADSTTHRIGVILNDGPLAPDTFPAAVHFVVGDIQ